MIGFIVCDKPLAVLVPACVFVAVDNICAHVNMCLHADGGGSPCAKLCVSEMCWDSAEPCSSSWANTASCCTSNSSPRHVMHPAACVSSVCDTTKSSGGELKKHAYRPLAPPPASVSWKLWRWSSCFSLRTCSFPRPTLLLWLCTSCLSSGR